MANSFYCTTIYNTTRRIVHKVILRSISSGIWLQQNNTYTKLTEDGEVTLTVDTTVVCVSSRGIQDTAWYFRGGVNEGVGELVNDMTDLTNHKGFLN
ncbi:hypothetical protein LOD99_9915 [Oopsacas minuta]|uniref:Uncharacterized protein n=1 Tax=Oopsacas minuta TaxID=111878 RepID=A0AAV7KK73_9METZ|nr:hypothetical protein LOD99_9915 [Oopsacas minuta]